MSQIGRPLPDLPFQIKAFDLELFKSRLRLFQVFSDPFWQFLRTIGARCNFKNCASEVELQHSLFLPSGRHWETDFYPVWVLGGVVVCLWWWQTAVQHWIKLLHPWVQKLYPVLGLGSGGRLLEHCQTPVLYWMHFSLRDTFTKSCAAANKKLQCNTERLRCRKVSTN